MSEVRRERVPKMGGGRQWLNALDPLMVRAASDLRSRGGPQEARGFRDMEELSVGGGSGYGGI